MLTGLDRLTGLLLQDADGNPAARDALRAVLAVTRLSDLRDAKLGYPLLDLARQWGLQLTDDQAAELARLRRRETVMNVELAGVAGALSSAPGDYLLMRGPALARFYPARWVRQYNDLDILLRDGRSVPEILQKLAQRGYYVARPVVSRSTAAGLWFGIALNKQVEGLAHPMYLDLTSLGPGLSGTRSMTLPAAAWRSLDTIQVNGTAVPVPSCTWQAVLFAIELAERRGSFAWRDVLDLAMLDRSAPDWPTVRSLLKRFPEAAAGLGALARLGQECARAAGLMNTGPGPLTVSWPARRLRPPGPRALTVTVAVTLIKRVRQRRPALARWMAERAPAGLWFSLGLPLYLLPSGQQALAGADGYRLAGLPGYRARIYPLVPRGYSKAAFGPRPEEVAGRQ